MNSETLVMRNKKVILCIDDEMAILQSLKAELKSIFNKDYLIEISEDGYDALELVQDLLEDDYEISLVISDYLMPQMKGDEILKHIHQKSPETIKIMLTGQATVEGVGNAIEHAQLYRYISKPWQSEDFKLTVKEAVSRYIQNEQLKIKNKRLDELNKEQTEFIDQLQQKEKSLQELLDIELKLKKSSSRFVPNEYLSFLNKRSIVDINLGDHVIDDMTIMFSDIRSFTSFSENMTAKENFDFVNRYLGWVSLVIRNHRGFVVKYLGDGIHAIFPESADDALRSCIEQLQILKEHNVESVKLGLPPIKLGIGLNTGRIMVGMVGESNRLQGDAFSDHVNLTARLEGLTKYYSVSLIISEATKKALEDTSKYHIRFLDKVQVKGKTKALDLYEVYDSDSEHILADKKATQQEYEEALECYYARDFNEAQSKLLRVIQANPKDKVAWRHLMAVTKCIEDGVAENWTGVTVMTKK